ncbi:tetratricopeptide repeat protein [Pseudomonas berkeleyensis]|uniref:Sel1 repeat family protein n=1 Tax=Pseudomonas berkeleyensis TaxID=2726956 RepID=A0A7G5DRL2_9PSED|nr:tetratricopeptide repeat protein [Pseudomonas berkeleyensis]QMV64387.1 sel1 repeat family protein [Pseudomonas berkeleyensis]WSO39851.1 tetratricopeptide repeat protein [Pseudomonas berkeleyensis]
MNRTGRTLSLGCLLLFLPLFALAGGNSLLIPASGSCALNATPEDMPDALASCQEMARAGNMQAAYELGEYYYDGKRTPRDFKQALTWFERASLQGHAEAQLRLGTMFFRGEGVPANNVQAYIVLKMASVNGSDEAMDSADLVSAQMRRDELEIASQVLGQIFRSYLLELQTAEGRSPFSPLP